jgi:hypothetical protein
MLSTNNINIKDFILFSKKINNFNLNLYNKDLCINNPINSKNIDFGFFNEDYFNDETISYILEKTREKKYTKTRAKLLEDRADELAKKTEGLLGNVFSGELQAQDGGIDGMTMVRGARVPYQAKNISLDIDTFLSYYNSYKSRDYLGGAFYANNVTKELIDYLHRLFSDGNCITVLKCEFILPKKEYNNYIIEWTY